MSELNNLDMHLQRGRPVIMAPKFEALPPITKDVRCRYIMAEDGLWVESKPCWGHVRLRLWKSPVTLPYGKVARIAKLPVVSKQQRQAIVRDAIAHSPNEYAGAITIEHGMLSYNELDVFERSPCHVKYRVPMNTYLDVHSHGVGKAYFSATDDNDDKGGVRACFVVGGLNQTAIDEDGLEPIHFSTALRLVVDGMFFSASDVPELNKTVHGIK